MMKFRQDVRIAEQFSEWMRNNPCSNVDLYNEMREMVNKKVGKDVSLITFENTKDLSAFIRSTGLASNSDQYGEDIEIFAITIPCTDIDGSVCYAIAIALKADNMLKNIKVKDMIMSFLVHELTHVKQFKELGLERVLEKCLGGIYLNDLEIEAYEEQAMYLHYELGYSEEEIMESGL